MRLCGRALAAHALGFAVGGTALVGCLVTTDLDGLAGPPVASDASGSGDGGADGGATDASRDAGIDVSTPTGLRITRLRFIDNDTGNPLPGYDPIPGEVTVSKSLFATGGTLEAFAEGPVAVGSVAFDVDMNETSVENFSPYVISGDRDGGGYLKWNPPLGMFVLTVTPYSQSDRRGMQGASATVRFTVQP